MGCNQTRDCIDRALVDIMSEKNLDRISTVELVRKAGVSRTTFYRYYESVPQMSEDLITRFLEGFRASSDCYVASKLDPDNLAIPDPGFIKPLTYVHDTKDLFMALSGPHGNPSFTQRFVDIVREFYGGKLAYYGYVSGDYDMRLRFVLASCPGMLRYWLSKRHDLTPAGAASIFQHLIIAPYVLQEQQEKQSLQDQRERKSRFS